MWYVTFVDAIPVLTDNDNLPYMDVSSTMIDTTSSRGRNTGDTDSNVLQ